MDSALQNKHSNLLFQNLKPKTLQAPNPKPVNKAHDARVAGGLEVWDCRSGGGRAVARSPQLWGSDGGRRHDFQLVSIFPATAASLQRAQGLNAQTVLVRLELNLPWRGGQ